MVVTFYSGSLVAFLTFPQYEFPVNNLEKLLEKQNEYNWGFQQNSVVEKYLETTEGDNYKVKKPLQGMAPTECLPSACLPAYLLACLLPR